MILRVYAVKSGQKLVCIPKKDAIKQGDLVVVKKATPEDLGKKLAFVKRYWFCGSCKNSGVSECLPDHCPFCNSDDIIEVGGVK